MTAATTRTTCPYCGVGCGVLARAREDGSFEIGGDPDHPANFGNLCSKGAALGETLDRGGRLLHPHVRGERKTWDEALDSVANGLRRIIDSDGPNAVAFYVSGQLLTEDHYVANKLMKGYIGSANIDSNSRLSMSSAVSGHKRAFGEDLVPLCYDDLALADLVVLVGSNTAWCHPVLFQRITAARQERPDMRIVVIDPRRTGTCEFSDLHLPVRAGTDVWLFNGLLAFLHQYGTVATEFIARSTSGVEQALRVAEKTAGDLHAVAKTCGIDERALVEFYRLFARTEKTLTVFAQGVNQSSAGTDKVNSIINCHLLTGRIGRPGMGPFSLTDQSNAMGGREAGGLATMLAAHMDLEVDDHRRVVQQFWNSPTIASAPGLKAVDLFDAIYDGRVKAVWIMGTNPIVSMPDAERAREALRRCELVVASDCIQHTDTTRLAHVLLPAAAWGEKDGTVTNSDRRISRQRAFLPVPGEARPDWWIITQVARRLGYEQAFAFQTPQEIFSEHAALSGAQNNGSRAFDIRGLSSLSSEGYDQLAPIQWPVPEANHPGTVRLLSDGRYFHPDGRARFVATPPRLPVYVPDHQYPLVLNTGCVRDQWHSMTRTGYAPRLTSHAPEPYVDMHAQDALLSGLRAGELVRVTTRWGSIIVRLRITGEMPRGMIFVPTHWNGTFSSDARVGALVNPVVDPVSGAPEFKHTPARVLLFNVKWHGFVLSRTHVASPDVTWWTQVRGNQHLRYEIAGRRMPTDLSSWARWLLNAKDDSDWVEYSDPAAHLFRAALLVDDRLTACVYLSPRPDLPARTWLASLFARDRITEADRAGLLMGLPADPRADTGAIVCSCFGVGRKTIVEAIRRDRLRTVQEVGQKLRAGTNCGSCLAEIRALLAETRGEPAHP